MKNSVSENVEKLVDAGVIAELVGVGVPTVWRWARLGIIPSLKISHKVRRFYPSQVLSALGGAK